MRELSTRAARRAGAATAAVVTAASALLAATSAADACSTPLPVMTSTLGCGAQCAPAPGCHPTGGGSGTMVLSTGGIGGGGTSTARGGGIFDVAMVDFTFTPNTPIIQPGTTVRWSNNGLFQHTTTRTATWDSGIVNPGNFFDFTFANAGLAYDYVCTLHFGMEGVINVARFGDANLDGLVNLADFNTLAANFGTSGQNWDTGDFNGDGNVNLNDFNLLAANFGREIEPALQTLVFGNFIPEPACAAILLPAALFLSRCRRRA